VGITKHTENVRGKAWEETRTEEEMWLAAESKTINDV